MIGAYASAGVSGAHLESRGDARARGAPRLPVEQGRAVHHGADRRRVRRVGGRLRDYREALDASTAACGRSAARPGTAGIFATYPQAYLSLAGGFVDQVVGTALLVDGIFALERRARTRRLPLRRAGRRRRAGRSLIGATFGYQRRLRDQPGARLRAAPVHVRSPAGAARCSAPATAGGGCRIVGPCDRRACSAASSTTCLSPGSAR